MALIEFKNLPDQSTPLKAENLNNNFEEMNKYIALKYKALRANGWYRFAELDNYAGTGSRGANFLVDIHTFFNESINMAIFLSISIAEQKVIIKELSKSVVGRVIDQVRVVYDSTARKMYLDIHYNMANSNVVYVNILNFTETFAMLDPTEPLSEAETGTVYATFDVTY